MLLTRFCDLKLWLLGINRWVDSKAQRLDLFMLPIILVSPKIHFTVKSIKMIMSVTHQDMN